MRNIYAGFAAALLAAAAIPATAQAQSGTQSSQPRARTGDNANEGERMVCMRVQLSGSRVTRRVCRTQSEWESRGELHNDPR